MTTFFLIRHAETDFVAKRRLAGRLPSVHLNEQGKAQAQALAKRLEGTKISAIYSSPLERTMETAETIARALRLKVLPREGLLEVDVGRWQGQALKTLTQRKLWPIVLSTPSLARFPGGESFNEAQARVVAELESLQAAHHRSKEVVAVVSHGDPLRLAIAHYLGLPLDLFQRLALHPASLSILQVGNGRVRLLRLNDIRTD